MDGGCCAKTKESLLITTLLTINTGSSSLKAALYTIDQSLNVDVSIAVDRIGTPRSRTRIADSSGTVLLEEEGNVPGHADALHRCLSWLQERGYLRDLAAAGHRVVHGGERYSAPAPIDAGLMATLRQLVPIDPNHLPQAIAAIEAVGEAFPAIPQIACFDTAFHRRMPRVAQIYGLPREVQKWGIIRYGFHGLSYESIMQQLKAQNLGSGRIVIAHLGNGASMAAVRDGRGIDTTMGFSPTGGLVMGTRSGDLDPGVLLYLLEGRGLHPDDLNRMVNTQSGLLGVSGIGADMRELLAREGADEAAADAVNLFCYTARKHLGALVAALGGLDLLVFTGGIGEHAAPVRARICAGLEDMGLRIDKDRNDRSASIISSGNGSVTIRVMETDEDSVVAQHTHALITERGDHGLSV